MLEGVGQITGLSSSQKKPGYLLGVSLFRRDLRRLIHVNKPRDGREGGHGLDKGKLIKVARRNDIRGRVESKNLLDERLFTHN